MSYKATDIQEVMRSRVRDFAEKYVKPIAFELDRENRFPEDVVKKLGELDILGIPYPKEYGGAGLDNVSYAIAVEELSRVDGGTGVILSAHVSLGSYPIYAFGTPAQKEKCLKPLARGVKIGAFGLTEVNAGSDASGTETTAVLQGDYYLLNGSKIFITNAPYADTYIVFAVTEPNTGTHGISAFIVEKGFEGFSFGVHYDKMGIRSSSTAELVFKNVRVPRENLLGKEGEGFKIAMSTLDGGRIGIAAQALGIAQGAYESALEYSKERVQFGKPICSQQIVAFKLADMATKLRAARLLIYSAAELKDAHQPFGLESAMAKQYASDVCLEIVNDALQIHGGNGFIRGMDVERAYRDAKICTIYEGTNEIQRVVIASHIIGKLKKAVTPVAKPAVVATGGVVFEGSAEEKVAALVAALKAKGFSFAVKADVDAPIADAARIVSVGVGVGNVEKIELARALAVSAGAALGCSRPVAEMLKYLPMNRYVGVSGQKFKGELYFACGISGAMQHLKGISDTAVLVAINNDANAPIFKSAHYGIVGDLEEILPLLTAQLAK